MKRPNRSRVAYVVLGLAITIFWLGMMFSLVRDKILPQRRAQQIAASAAEPAQLVKQWKDFEEYMIIMYNGQNIGAASTAIKKGPGESAGFDADFKFGVNVQILGMQRVASILARAELDESFDLSRFHIVANLGAMDVRVTGVATADQLLVEIKQGERIERTRLALDRRISFLEAVRPLLTRNFTIRPGNSMAIPVVDPVWSMERGTLQATVIEKEEIIVRSQKVQAFRVETRLNEFVSTSWVDESGATLKRQLFNGLFLERATKEHATNKTEALNQQITIPALDTDKFEKLPVQPLDQLSQQNVAPMKVLGTFFNLQ